MPPTAAYDEIADWYAEWVDGAASDVSDRVHELLDRLLGPGNGQLVLDICCGTGARVPTLLRNGWRPVGVDLSRGQLQHAAGLLPVALADATALPIASSSVNTAISVLCHTDLPDYPAVLREAARVLRPGGRFVHIGVHPCFVGAFADRTDPGQIIVDAGYERTERRWDSWSPNGVRARIGAWHTPLSSLLQATLDAGFAITETAEAGLDHCVPDVFAFRALRGRGAG